MREQVVDVPPQEVITVRQRGRLGRRRHLLRAHRPPAARLQRRQLHPGRHQAGADQPAQRHRRHAARRGAHLPRQDQHRAAPDPRRRHRQVGRAGGPGRDPAHRPAARRHALDARADEGRAHPAGRRHPGRRRAPGRHHPGRGRAAGGDPAGRGRQAAADPAGRGRGRGHPAGGRGREVPPGDGGRGRGRGHRVGLRRHPRRRARHRAARPSSTSRPCRRWPTARPPRSSCPPSWPASPGRSRRSPSCWGGNGGNGAAPEAGGPAPDPVRPTPPRRIGDPPRPTPPAVSPPPSDAT